jgi:RNA polymerase sigma-70 factor (ECF subfamily)
VKKGRDISELVVLLKASDYDAFSDIFTMYCKQVYAFCCKSLLREDAEEIVQNVFMAVWENRHKVDTQYSFPSYLFSIAKYQIYNAIRQKVAQRVFMEKYLQQPDNSSEIPEEYDDFIPGLKTKMKNAIRQLPDRQREIFVMSRIYQLTYKDIAEKLGISENTVDTSIRRSLNTLRETFRKITVFIFCFL